MNSYRHENSHLKIQRVENIILYRFSPSPSFGRHRRIMCGIVFHKLNALLESLTSSDDGDVVERIFM
jgi:hypothetical protein